MITLVSISGCKKEEDPPPAPIANFSFNGAGGNAPATVTFTNSSSNATSYNWDFGDGSTSTEKNPQHIFTSGGTFTVELIAKGEGGSNSKSKTINISDIEAPVANFTISGAGGFAPSNVTFTNTSTYANSYSWDFGDGSAASTEISPTHIYNVGGVFTATLTATGDGGTNSLSKTVNIESTPTKVQIDKIVLLDYPQANPSGGGWDSYNGPDIYWKLMDEDDITTYFTSGTVEDAVYGDLPFTYSNGLPFIVNNLNLFYNINFYDSDWPDSDDYMDFSPFDPSDYSDYPSVIHFNYTNPDYIDFDLYLTWSNSKNSINTEKEITITVDK